MATPHVVPWPPPGWRPPRPGPTSPHPHEDRTATYTPAASAEADPRGGNISVVPPVGKAVVGAVVGDEVAVRTPKGERKYKVTAVDA